MAHEYRPAPMSLAQRAALRQQEPRTLRRPARRRIYPIVILLLLLVAFAAAIIGFEYYYRDRVYPRVRVTTANLAVGGMSQDGVAATLRPYSVDQTLRVVALIATGRPPILVNGASLGFGIERGRTAWRAFNVGREGDLLHRATAQVKLLVQGAEVPIAQHVDSGILLSYLFKLSPSVSRPARPGVAGRRLDVATARREISAHLLATQGGFKYYLPFIKVPALPVQHKAVHHAPKRKAAKKH